MLGSALAARRYPVRPRGTSAARGSAGHPRDGALAEASGRSGDPGARPAARGERDRRHGGAAGAGGASPPFNPSLLPALPSGSGTGHGGEAAGGPGLQAPAAPRAPGAPSAATPALTLEVGVGLVVAAVGLLVAVGLGLHGLPVEADHPAATARLLVAGISQAGEVLGGEAQQVGRPVPQHLHRVALQQLGEARRDLDAHGAGHPEGRLDSPPSLPPSLPASAAGGAGGGGGAGSGPPRRARTDSRRSGHTSRGARRGGTGRGGSGPAAQARSGRGSGRGAAAARARARGGREGLVRH